MRLETRPSHVARQGVQLQLPLIRSRACAPCSMVRTSSSAARSPSSVAPFRAYCGTEGNRAGQPSTVRRLARTHRIATMPFTLRNLKENVEDVGSRFDGAPDL